MTRREVLTMLGASGAAVLNRNAFAQGAVPACVVRPQQTEGPYFVDEKLDRSDIRSDPASGTMKPGAPLQITLNVSRAGAGCTPLAGAIVDLWHCDALGAYSDVTDPGGSTVGQKFLRGSQVTDAGGKAHFTTIYPGWYQGRAVHVHFKIRTRPPSGTRPSSGPGHEFTSQLYFDDALTDRIHALAPYATRGRRTVRNEGDGLFLQGGRQLILGVTERGPGYAGTFDIGLQIAGA